MLCDYHIHTVYSDDSWYEMEDVVKDAIELGLNEIVFTDHVDYGIKKDWDSGEVEYRYDNGIKLALANVDYPKYVDEIHHLQDKYKDKISIKLGLEFGMQRHYIDKYQELFNRYPFDFIILSVHQVDDKEFWSQDYQVGKTQKEYNEGYYNEILYLVQNYKDYSVLGHLDMIRRYDKAGFYPYEKVKPIITEILKTVIKDGKGIEVNTSSHRYNIGDLTPSRDILKLYKELGGTIITIGSDTHEKEHLGAYIDYTKEELLKLGFTHYTVYDGMKPKYMLLREE